VTRFAQAGDDPAAVAKFALTLLACLRGSICLYQGEELGLEEADIAFEDLRDPYGIRFWPGFKGRDGCRTPMPWEAERPHAGFSTAKPWLPVPENHRAQAADTQGSDSVLAHYRAMLAFRKAQRALVDGSIQFIGNDPEVLAFVREEGNERLLCLFNFGRHETLFQLPENMALAPLADIPGSDASFRGQVIKMGSLGTVVAVLR
jgi:alpha-glucosidase